LRTGTFISLRQAVARWESFEPITVQVAGSHWWRLLCYSLPPWWGRENSQRQSNFRPIQRYQLYVSSSPHRRSDHRGPSRILPSSCPIGIGMILDWLLPANPKSAIFREVLRGSSRALRGSIGSMSPVSVSAMRSTRRRQTTVLVILTTVAVSSVAVWLLGTVAATWDARDTRRAVADGRLDDAARAVERWLLSSPSSAEAHFYKARIAWAQNDFATTDVELARARALGYAWQPSNRLLGLLLADEAWTRRRGRRMGQSGAPIRSVASDAQPPPC
jgi:hypothetical protein